MQKTWKLLGVTKRSWASDCVMLLSGRLNPCTSFFFTLSRCTTCCHSSKPDVISVQSRASVSQCSPHLSLSLSPSPAGPWEIMACCIAVSGVIRLCRVAAPSLWCSCPLQGGWGPIAYTRYSDRAGGDWQQHAPVWDGRANPLLRCFSSGLQRRAAHTGIQHRHVCNNAERWSTGSKSSRYYKWYSCNLLKSYRFKTMSVHHCEFICIYVDYIQNYTSVSVIWLLFIYYYSIIII